MLALSTSIAVQAQDVLNDSIAPTPERELSQAQVTGKRKSVSRMSGAENGFTLSRTELFKAACCNLGESFTTNPSVDVSYSDAATGAKQIKLLGLAGSYVQMLSEKHSRLQRSRCALRFGLCAWTLDAEHTGVEGQRLGKERL